MNELDITSAHLSYRGFNATQVNISLFDCLHMPQPLEMQLQPVWMPAQSAEPSTPDAKAAQEPGSRDTKMKSVSPEPGSQGATHY